MTLTYFTNNRRLASFRHKATVATPSKQGNRVAVRLEYDAPLREVPLDQVIYDAGEKLDAAGYVLEACEVTADKAAATWSADLVFLRKCDLATVCIVAAQKFYARTSVRSPDDWKEQSLFLLHDARVLYGRAIKARQRWMRFHNVGGKLWPHFKSARALASYAIENALKGIIAWNDPYLSIPKRLSWGDQKGHDLLYLAKEAKITLDAHELLICTKLMQYGLWRGRYRVDNLMDGVAVSELLALKHQDNPKRYFVEEYREIKTLLGKTIFPTLDACIKDSQKWNLPDPEEDRHLYEGTGVNLIWANGVSEKTALAEVKIKIDKNGYP